MKTILVVEDEKELIDAINTRLKSGGFEVMRANNAKEALDILETGKKIDLIWLDHYFPGINGLEFTAIIKKDDRFKNIPIFLITNSATNEEVHSYMVLGVDKYYVKLDESIESLVGDVSDYLKTS